MEADDTVHADTDGSQPIGADRSACHGRFGSCRTDTFLLALWHIPTSGEPIPGPELGLGAMLMFDVVRQASLRLHLRSRSVRQHLPPLDPITHVTTPIRSRSFSGTRRSPARRPLFFYPHNLAIGFRVGLLLASTRPDILGRYRTTA